MIELLEGRSISLSPEIAAILRSAKIFCTTVDVLVIDCARETLDRLLARLSSLSPQWIEVRRVEFWLDGTFWVSIPIEFWLSQTMPIAS